MGQVFWISGLMATAAIVWAVSSSGAERQADEAATHAIANSEVGEPVTLSSGSALATAAFGMSALQPETYNGETVLELIKASPLAPDEKLKLHGELRAAEAGEIELAEVLTNVRVALAVE